MTVYYVNEAAFELPWDETVDRSVNVFERVIDGDNHLSLSVQRGVFQRGESIATVIEQQIDKASRSLRSHEVLARQDADVGGQAAVDVAARWRSDKSVVYTRQVLVDAGATWLLLSVNAPIAFRSDADAGLERVLASLRLRLP
jgi:hypothetical protein